MSIQDKIKFIKDKAEQIKSGKLMIQKPEQKPEHKPERKPERKPEPRRESTRKSRNKRNASESTLIEQE